MSGYQENLLSKLVSTYSIVAMDRNAGEMGGAVQSHFFSVASAVLWAEAGSGVIATQSVVNRQYGPDGLALLREKHGADAVLRRLLEHDSGSMYRQAAVLDRTGHTSAHTGSSCIREAGHNNGMYFSVQANMMLADTVWDAMKDVFLASKGTLAERMLAALEAAEREGGDIRGKQSAGMVVVKTESTGDISSDNVLNLRVEDNPEPLQELSRLLGLYKGYQLLEQGDEAMEKQNAEDAMILYEQARSRLGGNPEALYWHGIALLNAGKTREGLALLDPLFRKTNNWLELTLRLPESGLASFDVSVLRDLQEELSDKP